MLVFTSLCVSLDSGAVHNWKALVHHLHYTMTDVCQLSVIEQRVCFVVHFDHLVLLTTYMYDYADC